MNRVNRLSVAIGFGLLSLLVLPLAFAQRGAGPGQRARMYNPANETIVKGAVEEVKNVTGKHGWNGTHLVLKVPGNATDVRESVEEGKVVAETLKKGDRTVDVHLGPAAYLKEKGVSFAKGDEIEVTGAKADFQGSEAIIAREVKKGTETLVLRDAQGIPKWSRSWWRR